MNTKETLLGAIVTEEIISVKDKLDFWGQPISLPDGQSWVQNSNITLSGFLEKYPIPGPKEDITLYGIAWEFVWGKKPPQEIREARKNLLDTKQNR